MSLKKKIVLALSIVAIEAWASSLATATAGLVISNLKEDVFAEQTNEEAGRELGGAAVIGAFVGTAFAESAWIVDHSGKENSAVDESDSLESKEKPLTVSNDDERTRV